MKLKIHWILIGMGLLAPAVHADEISPPTYFTNVKGALFTGVTHRERFTLKPGSLGNCKRTEASSLVVYRCDVTGAEAKVEAVQKTQTYKFTKMSVMFKAQSSGDVVGDYRLEGDWQDDGETPIFSKVHLTLWNYRSQPSSLRGSLSLVDLGVTSSIQAIDSRLP